MCDRTPVRTLGAVSRILDVNPISYLLSPVAQGKLATIFFDSFGEGDDANDTTTFATCTFNGHKLTAGQYTRASGEGELQGGSKVRCSCAVVGR